MTMPAATFEHMLDIINRAKRGETIEYRVKAGSQKYGPRSWKKVDAAGIQNGRFFLDFQEEEYRVKSVQVELQPIVKKLESLLRTYSESGSSGGHWLSQDLEKMLAALKKKL
jgi:hypothetical protein